MAVLPGWWVHHELVARARLLERSVKRASRSKWPSGSRRARHPRTSCSPSCACSGRRAGRCAHCAAAEAGRGGAPAPRDPACGGPSSVGDKAPGERGRARRTRPSRQLGRARLTRWCHWPSRGVSSSIRPPRRARPGMLERSSAVARWSTYRWGSSSGRRARGACSRRPGSRRCAGPRSRTCAGAVDVPLEPDA
jgi:hypothetical protein